MLEITLVCTECGTPNNVPVAEGATDFTCLSCGASCPISDTLDALHGLGEDPLIGAVISECEIVEKVGEGGFGAVYRALDRNLQRPVAVKILLQSLTANKEFVGKFYREAITAANLNHPHIVAIHKVGRDEDRSIHYLIMEFLEGQTLADLIEVRGPLPIEESVSIVQQSADALAAAHQKNIIHRDIKPENIMIDARGNVKITDFGLAKVVNPDMRSTKVVGTPHYMSPEQFEGKAVDGRTDIYSLGVTFYYMLTRAKPYEGTNTVQVIYSILTHEPRPPMEVNPGVPEDLWTIIQKMIEKDPESRYQGFREVQRDLAAFGERTLKAMVQCPRCEAENPQGRKYCRECGAPLVISCPKCESEEPAGTRHCGQCGSNIALALSVQETADRASRVRSRGELRQALRLYEEILQIEPENEVAEQATRELRETVERIDGLRQEAEQLASRGSLEEALGKIDEAMESLPAASELKTLRTEIQTKVTGKAVSARRMVAEEALAAHDYATAAEEFFKALEIDPEDPELELEHREALRKAEALEEGLAEARTHFDSQSYDRAFAAAKKVLALAPEHEVARDIHDRSRGFLESVDSLLDEARSQIAEGRYEEARTTAESALEVRPDEPGGQAVLEEAGAKLAAFEARLEDARTLVDGADLDAAESLLAELAAERSFDPRVGELRRGLEDLAGRRDRELRISTLLAEGTEAEGQGRLEEAAEKYEKIFDLDADHEAARTHLDEVREKIEDAAGFLRLAEEHEREGNLAQAVAALNRLLALRPGDAEIDERLRSLQRKKHEVEKRVVAAEEALGERRLEEAEDLAGQVLELSPRNRRAEKVQSEVSRLRTTGVKHVEEAKNRLAGEMYDETMALLDRAAECGVPATELDPLREQADTGRISVLKSNATRSFRFADFESAIEAYEEVLEVEPEDPEALAGRKAAKRKLRSLRRESPLLKVAASVVLLLGLGLVQFAAVSTATGGSDAEAGQAARESTDVVIVNREPWDAWTLEDEVVQGWLRGGEWERLEAEVREGNEEHLDEASVEATLAWLGAMREIDGLTDRDERIRRLDELAPLEAGRLKDLASLEQSRRLRGLQADRFRESREEWARVLTEGDERSLEGLLAGMREAQRQGATGEMGDLGSTIEAVEKLAGALRAAEEDPVAAIDAAYELPRPKGGPLLKEWDDIVEVRRGEIVERALEKAWRAEEEDLGEAEKLYVKIQEVLEKHSSEAGKRAEAGAEFAFALFEGDRNLSSARSASATEARDFSEADAWLQKAIEAAAVDPDRGQARLERTNEKVKALNETLRDRLAGLFPTTPEGWKDRSEEDAIRASDLFVVYTRMRGREGEDAARVWGDLVDLAKEPR
jgi:tetratricopeptide (TPR) repeat protein